MSKKEKIIVTVLTVWAFINLICLVIGWKGTGHEYFYPFHRYQSYHLFNPLEAERQKLQSVFTNDYYRDERLREIAKFDVEIPNGFIYCTVRESYDLSEFLVYAGTPFLIFFLYRWIAKKEPPTT